MHTERYSALAFTGYPTLLTLVGIDATDDVVYRGVKTTVDGINVWPKISGGNGTRREFLPVTEVSLIWKEQFGICSNIWARSISLSFTSTGLFQLIFISFCLRKRARVAATR